MDALTRFAKAMRGPFEVWQEEEDLEDDLKRDEEHVVGVVLSTDDAGRPAGWIELAIVRTRELAEALAEKMNELRKS